MGLRCHGPGGRVPGFPRPAGAGCPVSAYPRQEWAVPVVDAIGEALRLLNRHQAEVRAEHHGLGDDIDARMVLDFLPSAFTYALLAVGNIPGNKTEAVGRLIVEGGLPADAALREAGC